MLPLLLALTLLQDPGAWKVRSLTIVVQHSGAQRAMSATIITLLQRILALRPEKTEVGVIGFESDFKQLEGQRYDRKPLVLQLRTTDSDALHETVAGLFFNGPSPVWDALMAAQDDKPEKILLISNGIDNASQTSFDDLLAAAGKSNVPIVALYLANEPPAGGDTRLKKLAKAGNGRFIDLRAKDSWDQLTTSLR